MHFRHPNEAFFYDLDGTLTGTGIEETYTVGGSLRGSSFVGTSTLLPSDHCSRSDFSSVVSVCRGLIFRRSWFNIVEPSSWLGKALCVRMPWQTEIDTCQNLKPECSCLTYLKNLGGLPRGNVFLAAEGYRYNIQVSLQSHEMADPKSWKQTLWDMQPGEKVFMTMTFSHWEIADSFFRPLFWTANGQGPSIPSNYKYDAEACSRVGCGEVHKIDDWPFLDEDTRAIWANGVGSPGQVPLPADWGDNCDDQCHRNWAVLEDADGNGVIWTGAFRGEADGGLAIQREHDYTVKWSLSLSIFCFTSFVCKFRACSRSQVWPLLSLLLLLSRSRSRALSTRNPSGL